MFCTSFIFDDLPINRIEAAEVIKEFDKIDLEDNEARKDRILDILSETTTQDPGKFPGGVRLPADILVVPGALANGKVPKLRLVFT